MDNCGSFHFVEIQFRVFSAKRLSPGYQDVYALFHTKTNPPPLEMRLVAFSETEAGILLLRTPVAISKDVHSNGYKKMSRKQYKKLECLP